MEGLWHWFPEGEVSWCATPKGGGQEAPEALHGCVSLPISWSLIYFFTLNCSVENFRQGHGREVKLLLKWLFFLVLLHFQNAANVVSWCARLCSRTKGGFTNRFLAHVLGTVCHHSLWTRAAPRHLRSEIYGPCEHHRHRARRVFDQSTVR